MKKVTLIFGLIILCFIAKSQTPYYFYSYTGEKVYLSLDAKSAFLSLKEQQEPESIQQRSIRTNSLRSDDSDRKQYQAKQGTSRFYTKLDFEENLSDEQYLNLLADMKRQNKAAIISPYFKTNKTDGIGLSNFFYVKLKEEKDTILLREMAERIECMIIEQDPYMPLWFTLSITEASIVNAMEAANVFYESGLFQYAEPDLILKYTTCCVNDSSFKYQYGLKNTGQNGGTQGMDIRACEAWKYSKGAGVKIGIFDMGVELNHPDLANNINPLRYNCDMRTTLLDTIYNKPNTQILVSHGTMCAGVACAVQNNNGTGISGVAPESKIVPISCSFTGAYANTQQDLAHGFLWAWNNGIDIISCSWRDETDLVSTFAYIKDAIDRAVIFGRKGKGCLIFAASGNYNNEHIYIPVEYPACLPNVIAVGAVDNQGYKADFSQYGTDLDIMCPGVDIYTTDLTGSVGENTSIGHAGDYVVVSGTSLACPAAAAVAALVISINPNLTAQEVRNILESTAQKVRPDIYNYAIVSGRDNGTWCDSMGYGLIDAAASVIAAIRTISGVDLMIRDNPADSGIEPNNYTGDFFDSPDIWVRHKCNYDIYEHRNLHIDSFNSVFVRIKNIGDETAKGTDSVKLYWAKAGTDLKWDSKWKGDTFPTGQLTGHLIRTRAIRHDIKVGEEYLMDCFPFNVEGNDNIFPNPADYVGITSEPWAFYLLAVIESADDPLNVITTDIREFVSKNNNVAMKSINIGRTDLMIADNQADTGIEINPYSGAMWVSPSIWVRKNNDTGTIHENPESRPGNTNYVYVKIKNCGTAPSLGDERLFLHWSKGGTNLDWSGCWDGTETFENGAVMGGIIDSVKIPVIKPGKDTILEIPWHVPNPNDYRGLFGMEADDAKNWHFCLLARIIAPNSDPMSYPEVADLNTNVKRNNNIAWKNVSVIEVEPYITQKAVVFVRNSFDIAHPFCFKFFPNDVSFSLIRDAEVTVKLSDNLYEAWQRGGRVSVGIQDIGNQIFLIQGINARFCNVLLEAHEIGLLSVQFKFPTRQAEAMEYTYHLTQTDAETDEVIGGEVYHVITSEGNAFRANAGDDVYAFKDEFITLHAADVGEDAIYRWYDQRGNLVCEEMDFELQAIENQRYKLEVIALSDGYTDSDEVMVKIVPGKIEELFPNPAMDVVIISCVFNSTTGAATNAHLTISNALGVIYDMHHFTISPETVDFDISHYPTGSYIVRLICNGQIADTKVFVKE